jgi:hypothetical protein
MAGAPLGNRNAVKSKPWEEALKRALARAGNSVELGLNPIADWVVAAAVGGDIEAIREIACRLDGKPTEHVQVDQTIEINVGDSSNLTDRLRTARAGRSNHTVQ